MRLLVYRESRFNRCLERLRRGAKADRAAAQRADELIAQFTQKSLQTDRIHRRTKHGELRIEKCLKYNLGGGYRLLCLRREGQLLLLYIGSHDACDRWLENNRQFEPGSTGRAGEIAMEAAGAPKESRPERDRESQTRDYDDLLMEKIDQKTLRNIFRGLCGNAA
jgi:hypothetical protein